MVIPTKNGFRENIFKKKNVCFSTVLQDIPRFFDGQTSLDSLVQNHLNGSTVHFIRSCFLCFSASERLNVYYRFSYVKTRRLSNSILMRCRNFSSPVFRRRARVGETRCVSGSKRIGDLDAEAFYTRSSESRSCLFRAGTRI